jgi:ferredoxin
MKLSLNKAKGLLIQRIEELGHAVEYQCRKGYCGSCVAELLEGNVSYALPPKAFHKKGQVLLCCAVADTDVVVLFNE